MKTQKQQLTFNKNSILELNNQKLASIKGGTSLTITTITSCTWCVGSSNGPGTIQDYIDGIRNEL